jgi:hypothetical protein
MPSGKIPAELICELNLSWDLGDDGPPDPLFYERMRGIVRNYNKKNKTKLDPRKTVARWMDFLEEGQ